MSHLEQNAKDLEVFKQHLFLSCQELIKATVLIVLYLRLRSSVILSLCQIIQPNWVELDADSSDVMLVS